MTKRNLKLAVLGFSLTGLPGIACAEGFTITAPTFDLTSLGTYVGTILTGLAAVWLARKFIKMTNRS